MVQKELNRWFLRNIVLKGSNELSQQLMMAIYCTEPEVQDHCELVKLLKEKLSGISSCAHSSALMTSGSPMKTITEMFPITNTSEMIDQSGECVVSNVFQQSYFPRSIKDWNELPNYIIESNNLQSFTTLLINHYNYNHA